MMPVKNASIINRKRPSDSDIRHVSALTVRSLVSPFIKKYKAKKRLPAISSSTNMIRTLTHMLFLERDIQLDYAGYFCILQS
jgi:hypothetical protein